MAMQRSIDGGRGQGEIMSRVVTSKEETTRGRAAVWILARLAAVTALFGRAARISYERIRSGQAHPSKRRQMKLVESLSLGDRRQLLLVVCDNQRYLVGAGAQNVGSILAIDAVPAMRERAARGPELVRRRGCDADPRFAEAPRPNPWH